MLRRRLFSAVRNELEAFCRRWRIVELAVFGSAARGDFGPESDVDLLVTFAPDAAWTYLDHMRMELELVEILGREVDLVDRQTLAMRGHSLPASTIINNSQVIYSVAEAERAAR